MRAVIYRSFGAPEDVLEIEEFDTPEPGPGEVRVRIQLATIHNHDLMTIRGQYGYLPDLPARAGTEGMGVIDALGDGVEGLAVGDRVVAGTTGTWAEYVTMPAKGVVPVADGIPDEIAAQMVAMPFSALSLLDSLGLEKGDGMLQNAANGTVGRLLAQLAPARGITVVGLVRRSDAVAELAEEGVDTVVATDTPDWKDRVRELAEGVPLRAGLDSVGGDAAGDVLSLISDGGTLVEFGAMGSATLNLSVGDILFRGITVRGFWGAQVGPSLSPDKRTQLFGELRQRIADGTLRLGVDSIHPLDRITDAVIASGEAGRGGKVLIRP